VSAAVRSGVPAGGPSLRARLAAVAVAAVAAFALFSGPTTIPVRAPAKAVPTSTTPGPAQTEPDGSLGDR
jgi:hypothetical protein